MKLPGGLMVDGQLRRDFSFKPVTGTLERVIAESGLSQTSLAQQVTRILSCTLDRVAGLAPNPELVRSLTTGDRHYLIQQLEALIEPAPQWYTVACQYCEELIQFQLEAASLPVKPAGNDFPQTSLALSVGEIEIRVPTGNDEENITLALTEGQPVFPYLLTQLISHPHKSSFDSSALSPADIALIDHALEQMAPQASDTVSVNCPYCTRAQQIKLDSYAWITRKTHTLDEEIHTLATHYHWSEREILELPRTRRQRYLQMIERHSGGLHIDEMKQNMSRSGR